MEKSKFTARDILVQLFDDDYNFTGSHFDGEGEYVNAYRGLTLSTSTLREESLESFFQVLVKALFIVS